MRSKIKTERSRGFKEMAFGILGWNSGIELRAQRPAPSNPL